jgi:hypothetical protein
VICGDYKIALSDHRVNIIAHSALDTCLSQFDVSTSFKMELILNRREVFGCKETAQHLKSYDLVNIVL